MDPFFWIYVSKSVVWPISRSYADGLVWSSWILPQICWCLLARFDLTDDRSYLWNDQEFQPHIQKGQWKPFFGNTSRFFQISSSVLLSPSQSRVLTFAWFSRNQLVFGFRPSISRSNWKCDVQEPSIHHQRFFRPLKHFREIFISSAVAPLDLFTVHAFPFSTLQFPASAIILCSRDQVSPVLVEARDYYWRISSPQRF